LHSVNPWLESAWFQPLTLRSDKPGFSKFCFFQIFIYVCRCTKGGYNLWSDAEKSAFERGVAKHGKGAWAWRGLYELNPGS
jgi:hypothetical protein